MMVDVHHRLEDMVKTLEERNHPLFKKIRELHYLDLDGMSERLVELPGRYQYMGPQIDELRVKVEAVLKEIE